MKKTTFALLVLAGSFAAARAQDATCTTDQAACPTPTVVYDAPVVYNAPVVYQQPVVYNAPVYYATPGCAPIAYCEDASARSTVVYIGGGNVRYQASRCNSGSTVTYIGGSR
jgi:hypothetical protein